jgi:hypothetical protein
MSIILRSLPHRDSAAYGDGQAEERQTPMWVLATELPVSPSHPFGCARAKNACSAVRTRSVDRIQAWWT